jgi:hypothetical protein
MKFTIAYHASLEQFNPSICWNWLRKPEQQGLIFKEVGSKVP